LVGYTIYLRPKLFTFKSSGWCRCKERELANAVSAEGVSHNPCSDLYCGPSPASEPETIAMQNEARRLASELRGWLTMHAYGAMWMFPYATSVRHSPDSPCHRVPEHNDLVLTAASIPQQPRRYFPNFPLFPSLPHPLSPSRSPSLPSPPFPSCEAAPL